MKANFCNIVIKYKRICINTVRVAYLKGFWIEYRILQIKCKRKLLLKTFFLIDYFMAVVFFFNYWQK